VLTRFNDKDDRADTLDLHAGGVPKLDGASDIRVKLCEELPSTVHVMGGTGVEAPPVSLVIASAVAEEGVCSRLIKEEETRYSRCLRVPGAELAPPPPMRCGLGRVMAVDTPWPNGQACHSCGKRHLMSASGCQRHHRGPLCGCYPRPGRLRAPCVACCACSRPSRERTPPSSRHPSRPPTVPE
jgi:hypothetical protein